MSGLGDRLRSRFRRVVRASGTINPSQWLVDWIRGGEPTRSGMAVSPDTALRLAAVYACVRLIAEDVAKLPLHLYRRLPEGGKERVQDHPSARVLRAPNPANTGMELRETMTAAAVLRGAGFAEIAEDSRGAPVSLTALDPARTQLLTSARGDALGFRVQRHDGSTDDLPASRVLYLRGLSLDGVSGVSPIAYHRETVGLGLAAIELGARQFANDVTGGLMLKAAPGFHFGTDADRQKFLKAIKEQRTGDNRFEPLALEWGFEPVKISMTNEDAQYIEGRKFTRSEIASIFRVPPHKIGDLEKATFSNIEHQALEYVVDTLLPWLRRWEQRLDYTLLTAAEREVYFVEHLVDGLLRGDFKTRMEGYTLGRNGGWLSANDIRERENMNPIEGGDNYLTPLNMTALGAAAPDQGDSA